MAPCANAISMNAPRPIKLKREKNMIYDNPYDPRTFVYNSNKSKWMGVTLNMATRKSKVILFFHLLTVLCFLPGWCRKVSMAFVIGEACVVMFINIILMIYCFVGAARDLKKWPGPQGARD